MAFCHAARDGCWPIMRSPAGYALLPALPVLLWSRLVLKRHTPIEVALGTIIGAAAGAAIHYL